jgi:translation elongation factor EF-1beta
LLLFWRDVLHSLPGTKKAASEYGPGAAAATEEAKDEDDIDLFGDDEEVDEEAEKIKAQRVAEYNAKKALKGPGPVAKSSLLIEVKPWDDETDMEALKAAVLSIQADGLVWGASKLVPVAFGVKKFQINCIVEDDKISTDWLEEQITGFEDYVQSFDIAAFNKI